MKKCIGYFLLFGMCILMSCHSQKTDSHFVKELNEGWTYQEVNGKHSGSASVPGTIHTDLFYNSQIENPFYRTNEKDLQWIDKKDWEYKTSFFVDEKTMELDHLELYFAGLDTYADVYVNDSLLLEANNMHREWSVDTKRFIQTGDNQIRILFHSPIKRGLELYEHASHDYPANNDQSENGGLGDKKVSVFTRKAGYHYGWDWGPRFVTSGIWRPVELRGWKGAEIEDVYIKQPMVTSELAKLEAQCTIEVDSEVELNVIIKDTSAQKELKTTSVVLKKGRNEVTISFEIQKPRLWWSNGLGDPEMYQFELDLNENGQVLCSKNVSTGIRSIRLVREEDKEGESFLFELNGVPVFAKGANYIPNDSFLPRVSKSNYETVVADAKDANMNMLRVWGGGVYEDNYFYELCDRNGILVWQDFMFACSMYPGNKEMLENIEKEAIDNVKRLRNHPCIALWCGNNEINGAWNYYSKGGWGWKERYSKEVQEEMQDDYLSIFHSVLPKVVAKYTDHADYWPSSPQAGYEKEKHASMENTSGDMHYWGVWHGLHPFEDFDKYRSRFMSEYGFQSFPDFESVQTYTTPVDYDIESDVMSSHQRSGIGNIRIREYMSWYYQVPTDFEQFLYTSQVLQARSIRMAIEAHRRAMPYCMGSLYWQINDCWPVASWSSTDYYHKWKAVHYAVRKAFEPVLLSSLNHDDKVDLFIVSDFLEDKSYTLETILMNFDGEIYKKESQTIVASANTSTQLESYGVSSLKQFDPTNTLLVCRVKEGEREVASKYHYFSYPKDQKPSKPEIDVEIIKEDSDKYLVVSSSSLVRNLYLYDNRSGLVLEDNYFDLLPGEKKKIKVKSASFTISEKDISYRMI